MADTKRGLTALQALLADNIQGDIGADDSRDLLVSVYGTWRSKSITNSDSPYTITADDIFILGDTTAGAIVTTLPTGAAYNDSIVVIKKKNKSSNTITVNSSGGDTFLDGSTSFVITEFDGGLSIIKVGTNWVRIEEKNLASLLTAMKEPTGFPNRTDSNISFSDGSMLFTIAPAGAQFEYYIKGVKYIKTASENIAISDTDGIQYVYYNGSTLTSSTSEPSGMTTDIALIATINWDSTNNVNIGFAEERHGITMDGAIHHYLHDTRGCAWETGLAIGNYVLRGDGSSNTHAQISINDGTVYDEDIDIGIKNSASPANPFEQILSTVAQIPTYYRSGVSGVWRKNAAGVYPLKTGTARIQWNQLSGSWSQVDATTNGNFVAYWIFATSSRVEPVIAIMGQREDTMISDAIKNNIPSSLSFGNLILPEMKLIYRIIFQTSSAYGNTPKARLMDIVDYRQLVILAASGFVPIQAGAIGPSIKAREIFFIPAHSGTALLPYSYDAVLASGSSSPMSFSIPIDYVSIISIRFVFFSGGTGGTGTINAYSAYCNPGQNYLANTVGTSGSPIVLATAATNYVADQLYEIDLSGSFSGATTGMFPNIVAGMMAGIRFSTNGFTGGIKIQGIRFRYSIE